MLAESDPRLIEGMIEENLYVIGIGLCSLDEAERDRLQKILGPACSARALGVAVQRLTRDAGTTDTADQADDADGDSPQAQQLKGKQAADSIWDYLENS